MNHEFVSAIVVAVLTSSGLWGVLQLWLTSKQKKAQDEKDTEAKEKDARRTRQAEDSQMWYRESRHHYDIAKHEAEEARDECKECRKELEHTRRVVYVIFEEFEDQIIPLLEDVGIRAATREVIKKARESLRASPT